MYNMQPSDFNSNNQRRQRRARRGELYYNRTRTRHLHRSGFNWFRLTTMAVMLGIISLIIWSIG